MLHLLLSMPTPTSSKLVSSTNPHKSPNPKPNHPSSLSSHSLSLSSSLCKHSPLATLEVLILIVVVFSLTFLVMSFFADILRSVSPLISRPTVHLHVDLPVVPYALGFLLLLAITFLSVECLCGARSRRCHRAGCKGMKKALEFDLQLQTADCLKSGSRDIDSLPWKGGSETNPDYECLRTELRKMAPPNGRAVLLFRARCGCPTARLVGWAPKNGRRHKK
ncbi:hypothetical protein SAY86_003587 [Trapa natans]|uniref:Ribosomal protein L34e superfamily protein n=1 Tax=Trapa natans TaxID=22666 RepID=A0AAN7MWY3_TRANT|nr:hypothetical protein SAY86_003587 [Trapa natans]